MPFLYVVFDVVLDTVEDARRHRRAGQGEREMSEEMIGGRGGKAMVHGLCTCMYVERLHVDFSSQTTALLARVRDHYVEIKALIESARVERSLDSWNWKQRVYLMT